MRENCLGLLDSFIRFKNILFYIIDIGKGKLTVGKIYGGLLILENWKASKFGNMPSQKVRNVN